MLTHIKLENFKSWRELDIDLAPITLLYGTNSSGKSSVLQALLFIAQTMSARSAYLHDINFGGGSADYVDLGSYNSVVFRHDVSLPITIDLYEDIIIHHPETGDRGTEPHQFTFKLIFENNQVVNKTDVLPYGYRLFGSERGFLSGDHFHYLAPLRQYPQRAYIWTGVTPTIVYPGGDNAIEILIGIQNQNRNEKFIPLISDWLAKMGLASSFTVEPIDADRRFYESRVRIGNVTSSILDVGFGVSQVLPLLVMLHFVPSESVVLLEQPELHLHPRAQAVLADLFLEVAEKRRLQLIVESHSEHLLRRIQRRIAEPEYAFATPDNIKAYFCDKGEEGSIIQAVEIDEYGQIRNWPKDFFGDITGDLDALTDAAIARRRQELLNGG